MTKKRTSSARKIIKRTISGKLRLTGHDPARYHVIPQKGSWAVKREGAKRATKVVSNKSTAVSIAKGIVSSSSGVTVHRRDGTVERRIKTAASKKVSRAGK